MTNSNRPKVDDLPNISLRVDKFSSKTEKQDAVLRRVEWADKPGIVYVSTHKNAENMARELQQNGIDAVFYHGGLKAAERESIENRFTNGEVPVIVATNAFGQGVDKPDIRFVYHADVSDSVDGYYQEIGRAGRDGQPAEAVLFFRPEDVSAQQYKTGSGSVDAHALESVAHALASHQNHATREQLTRETSISGRKLTSIVHKLEEVGAARQLESGEIEAAPEQSIEDVAEVAVAHQQMQKQQRRLRLEHMQEYADCRTCRREFLLRHLGDASAGPCGNCDRCEEAGRQRKVA